MPKGSIAVSFRPATGRLGRRYMLMSLAGLPLGRIGVYLTRALDLYP